MRHPQITFDIGSGAATPNFFAMGAVGFGRFGLRQPCKVASVVDQPPRFVHACHGDHEFGSGEGGHDTVHRRDRWTSFAESGIGDAINRGLCRLFVFARQVASDILRIELVETMEAALAVP